MVDRWDYLYFEKRNSTVVKPSSEGFIMRKGTYLSGNNDKTIYNTDVDTCKKACLEEKTFFCKSFDFQIRTL